MALSYYVGNLPSEGHKKAKRREEKAAAKKESIAKKMYNAEMEAHKRIGSPGPAHVRSAEENKKFYKSLKK